MRKKTCQLFFHEKSVHEISNRSMHGSKVFFYFCFFFLLWMPFCVAEWHHFSILVEGHSRNIPVKLFQNPLIGL